MAGRRYLYLEHDGRVYLVERDGVLTFPAPEEAPCAYAHEVEIELDDAHVTFAVPDLARWPRDWPLKDEIPGMANVSPVVQRSVNASLVREVVGAIVLHGDEMLLVKSSRGFAKGHWNIPGGFVLFGESPAECVVREVAEECGLPIHVERLVGVYSARFRSPYFTRAHVFLTRAESRDLVLAEDEIAEARWFPFNEAREATFNPFARQALDALSGSPP